MKKVVEKMNKKIIRSKALLIGVLLALIILTFRMMITNNYYFFFLPWNLFLAFVPLFVAYKAAFAASGKRKLWLFFWIIVWLFFFPNAPYVITDFLHLMFYDDADFVGTGLAKLYNLGSAGTPNWIFWYDCFTIGFYSLLSWVAGLCSLQSVLKSHLVLVNKNWKQVVFFLGSMGLSGFGIFLGRFLRFNSWDIVARPFHILQNVAEVFTNGFFFSIAAVTTVCFALLLVATYVLFDSRFEWRFKK